MSQGKIGLTHLVNLMEKIQVSNENTLNKIKSAREPVLPKLMDRLNYFSMKKS